MRGSVTGEQLKALTSGDWDRAAKEVTQRKEEIQRLRKEVCDQDEALVEFAYMVSDAFKAAFERDK